ncbi:unnamed protein product, partial [Mesorhabditis belari]|uniref:C2H2-type domain-containing protein n=1 Tax=Mesorhabditis belari TaxID=2138241 RepID=A0AAF3F033_9BILA
MLPGDGTVMDQAEEPSTSLLKEESECETSDNQRPPHKRKRINDEPYVATTEDDTEMSELENDDRAQKKRHKVRGISKSLPHPCPHCQMRFLFPNKLRQHIENKHSKKHECANCSEKFDVFEELRKHWAMSHTKIYKCEICEYTHRKKAMVARHTRKQHENGVKCPIAGCPATMSAWRIGQHMTRCHPNATPTKPAPIYEEVTIESILHHCDWCSFATSDPKAYEYHVDGEHGGGVICPMPSCQMRMFLSKLNAHMEAYHCDNEDNEASCENNNELPNRRSRSEGLWADADEEEPKVVLLPSAVQAVLQQNTKGLSSVQCDVCHKTFGKQYALKKHVATVHERRYATKTIYPKKFPCTYEGCGKFFKSQADLGYHENVHTGTRPFKCPKCEFPFTSRAYLAKHLKRRHMTTVKDLTEVERAFGFGAANNVTE